MGSTPNTSTMISVTLPPHRVEQAARDATRRGLGPFCAAMAAYYLFMGAFHVSFGGTWWWVLTLACIGSSGLLTALAMLFRRSTPPRDQVYAWVVFLASLVIANITLFQLVAGEPRNFVNYAMVNVVAGLVVFTRPVLVGILLVDFAAWMLAERYTGMGNPMFDGGFLMGTWVLSIGLSMLRMGTLSRTEALRLHAEIALDRAERRLEQRDRAIHAHRRSQAGLRRLIEVSHQCVIIVQSGAVAYVNQAFRELIGMRRRAIVGLPLQDLVHPDDAELADLKLLQDESELGVELRFVTGQGESIPMEVTAAPMEYGQGPALLLIASDERSLDSPDRQALANRMLAVGTMAAGVAHEINNPLAYTIANLEMLSIELDGDHRELVGVALEGASRVRDIVADLRRFSREDEESLAAVDVTDLLQTSIRMSWNEIRHRARLERDYAEELPRVMANSSRLGQVFLNLLLNAAQAIGEGDASQEVITVRTRVSGTDAVIEVSDTGEGIPESIREQIFRPFFTTKPVGVGTGLGLPYCRNVVEELGGTIELESILGHGTTFRLRVPSCAALEGPATLPPEPPRPGPSRRILLIDDEAPLAEAIAAVLSSDEVVVAGSGAEALELLDGHWDAVLCDVMMPEMSGPEVYRRIVDARPDLTDRIAFVTGGTFTELTRGFLEETTAPVLSKPFRARAIRALVDQLVKA